MIDREQLRLQGLYGDGTGRPVKVFTENSKPLVGSVDLDKRSITVQLGKDGEFLRIL